MLSKVDLSVLEALPAELREQVEQSWTNRDGRTSNRQSPGPQPSTLLPQSLSLKSRPTSPPPTLYTPPVGTLVLQIPNQPNSPGIVLELPDFSQVEMQPFKDFDIRFLQLTGNLILQYRKKEKGRELLVHHCHDQLVCVIVRLVVNQN